MAASFFLHAQTPEMAELKSVLESQKNYSVAGNDSYTDNDSLEIKFNGCGAEYSYRYTDLLYMIDQLIVNQKSVYQFQWKDVVALETDFNGGKINLSCATQSIKYLARDYGTTEWRDNNYKGFALLFNMGANNGPQKSADMNRAVTLIKTIVKSCGGGEVKVTDWLDRLKHNYED